MQYLCGCETPTKQYKREQFHPFVDAPMQKNMCNQPELQDLLSNKMHISPHFITASPTVRELWGYFRQAIH